MITNAFSQIDLSRLTAPDVVEVLDYEVILAEMLADLRGRDSAFTALTEADPAYKILEVAACRELLIRQRINEAARSVMLAYAAGADLDQIAANFGVARLLIRPADERTIPPTPAVYETDEELRNRVTLSPEGCTAHPHGCGPTSGRLSVSKDVRLAVRTIPWVVFSKTGATCSGGSGENRWLSITPGTFTERTRW